MVTREEKGEFKCSKKERKENYKRKWNLLRENKAAQGRKRKTRT